MAAEEIPSEHIDIERHTLAELLSVLVVPWKDKKVLLPWHTKINSCH